MLLEGDVEGFPAKRLLTDVVGRRYGRISGDKAANLNHGNEMWKDFLRHGC